MTASVQVLLEIPAWISEGLASGSLKRMGGIVRRTDGTEQIFAHLREAADAGSHLTNTATASNLLGLAATGAQFLNLGITVAGFAILAQRLRSIDQRLDVMARELKAQRSALDMIQMEQRAHSAAALDVALEEAERGERLRDRQVMNNARARAFQSYREQLHLLASLVESGRAWSDPERFRLLFSRAALAAAAVGRCDWQIEGGQAAHAAFRAAASEMSLLFGKTRDALIDSARPPRVLVTLTPAQREALRPTLAACRECCSRLSGYAAEAELAEAIGYDWQSWQGLGQPPPNAEVVVVVVPPDISGQSVR